MAKYLYILIFLLVVPTVTNAVKPSDIVKDTTYLSSKKIKLRDAPPKGLFYSLGNITGLVKKQEKVFVKEVKGVKTLLGTHYWLMVERTDPVTGLKEVGWLYAGKKGSQSRLEEVQ